MCELKCCRCIVQSCCSTQAVKVFEDSGGLIGLETLEYANNEPLRQQADNILDTYFYKDEENGTVLPASARTN